jgi:hypothetical protein
MIDDLWYKNAIFYCLNIGTFMDANDDGVGDFEGLMRRLDYLAGLGVTALWLMPFQPSPHRDNGYDIQDYYGVDPRYGTLRDFVEFTQQARAASGSSSTWSSTTPRTNTPGSRRRAGIYGRSTVTITVGPRRGRRLPTIGSGAHGHAQATGDRPMGHLSAQP